MTDAMHIESALARLVAACRERGITGPEEFQRRYGLPTDAVPLDEALALVQLPEYPRAHDRTTWMPHQRRNYVTGCLRALDTYKGRLERGLAIIGTRPSDELKEFWIQLATRSTKLIGKLSDASGDAGEVFCESELVQDQTRLCVRV